MKISIITATYNSEATIADTINSVLSQDYSDIEYLVIDGGSSDATLDIVKANASRFGGRLRWISENDHGIYDAMNKGIRVATGDYIQFLGADDCLVDPYTIERVCNAICDDTDVFSAPCIAVNEKYHCEGLLDAGGVSKEDVSSLPKLPHPGVFVRSDVLKQQPFDTSYRIAADLKLLLKLYYTMKKKFQFADFPVTYFSLGGVSNKQQKHAEMENQRIIKDLALSDHASALLQHGTSVKLKSLIRNILDRAHLWGWFLCTFKNCRWCKRS